MNTKKANNAQIGDATDADYQPNNESGNDSVQNADNNQRKSDANENEADESDETDFHENDENDENERKEKSKPNWILRLVLVGLGIALIILLVFFGILPRLSRDRETKEAAEQRKNALPIVNFAKPKSAPDTSELVLPGTTQAVQETAINARASGFLTKRYVDIGDRVRAGQLLAEIDTPEVDQQIQQAKQQVAQAQQQVAGAQQEVAQARQQLNQAKSGLQTTNAQLKQAKTNQELANVTSRRSSNLSQKGLVSQQEADQNRAALEARKADTEVAVANIGDSQANIGAQQAVINTRLASVSAQQSNVKALQANVRRLQDLQGFNRITAPFSGIITARNVDVGGLVSGSGASSSSASGTDSASVSAATSSSASSSPTGATGGLFRLARLDAMKAYINVPQTFASSINAGLQTQVDIKEVPQREFTGKISRTSNSLDPNSRTLLAEVLIGNESGQILPGMYAQIKIAVPRTSDNVLIPSSALISRPNGSSVIVVNPDDTIHFQIVEVGRDYGKQISIINGLKTDERIVTNPTESMQENTKVEAREAPPDADAQKGGNNQQNQPQQNNQSGSQQPNSSGSQSGK